MSVLIEEALVKIVKDDSALTAGINKRIYDRLPESPVFPLFLYYKISSPELPDIPMIFPRFQINSLALTKFQAKQNIEICKDSLRRYRGRVLGIYINNIQVLDETDLSEGDDSPAMIALDIKVNYILNM